VEDGSGKDEEWDEAALAAKVTRVSVRDTSGKGASELLDMKALEQKRYEDDDIVERMRIEETRAKLAAAREGMEKEAERIKAEKEFTQVGSAAPKPRFGAAAGAVGGGGAGTKYVPAHMRSQAPTGMGLGDRMRMGGGSGVQRKVDTADENMFPDLAAADTIISQQQQQQKAVIYKLPKKSTKSWGMADKKQAPAPPPPVEEKKVDPVPEKEEAPKVVPTPVPTVASVKPDIGAGLKKKKKKKKDLSTFKAS
jgi:hypothetical protein